MKEEEDELPASSSNTVIELVGRRMDASASHKLILQGTNGDGKSIEEDKELEDPEVELVHTTKVSRPYNWNLEMDEVCNESNADSSASSTVVSI